MRKSRMVYAIAAVALCAMVLQCSKKTPNPVTPPDQPPGNVILSEGFEGDLSNYRGVVYTQALMSLSTSTQCAHSGTGSLTSDSNNTSIKRTFSPSIDDSIAGLQFYLMATKLAHTNFIAAICKSGSSPNGLWTIMGMGIDMSDSLKYIYENYPGDPINEHKTFAALTLNKWYKCKIEYDYSDTTLTYYLDDSTVYTRTTPSPMTLTMLVAMRDSLGAQGPSGYYIDDVAIYKR